MHSFHYVDLLFDFLLQIGMKPLLELSFMPSPIASGTQSVIPYRTEVPAHGVAALSIEGA